MAAPTSTNEVTARKFSSSISALWTKIKSTFQTLGNLVTAWGSTPSDTKYPSEKLVKDSLDKTIHLTNNPSDIANGASSSANSEILWQFSIPYFAPSGNNGIYILMYDVTAWYDGSHESYDGFAIFSGTFYVVKNTGYGEPVLAEISLKVSGKTERVVYLYSSTKSARPQIISRIENGVRKYYAAIYYGSSLYGKNAGLLGTWKWATSVVPNGFIGEVVSYATYPAGELYFDLEIDSSYFIDANTAVKLATSRTFRTNLGSTSTASFNGTANVTPGVTGTLPLGNGGTGKTTAKAAEYNLTTGKSEISDTTSGDDRVVFELASPSESNGVTRGFRKLFTIWTWIKGLLSSESGVNISGSSASCTGNAATATKATQDSDGNAINSTYFKSSGNTTLVSGAATKIGTQNGADVKLTLPTIPSGTQLVYDCGTGSTSTTDFDNALAAYNAGKWVIINKDSVIYHCVGAYNSNLRFKTFANESDLLKVRALTWTRESAPTVGTTLEAALTSQIPDISGKVNKSGDTMSGDLTISKGANQGDTKFVASCTDTGTTGWFGVGDGGKNHGVYSESAYANTNNDVDKYTKGWIVRTDENGYSSLVGKVDGLFSKSFGDSDTLMGMKRCLLGYSFDLKDTYTHVSATAIIEARLYSAGVSGGSITMLFNASARGDVGSYYRLQVISYNNWNVNNVCPVLIVQQSSATAKRIYLGLVSGGPASTTLRTFSFSEIKVLPINGTAEFTWEFGWDTNDFNSNTMTMIKPYVYPRAQIGTAIGSSSSPLYVKNDGDFATANLIDRAVGVKDAGRADAPASSDATVKLGWSNSAVPACTPDGTSTYSAGQTVGTTKHLVTVYEYNGVAYYKDVQAANVKVGDSVKWGGYKIQVGSVGSDSSTIYFT